MNKEDQGILNQSLTTGTASNATSGSKNCSVSWQYTWGTPWDLWQNWYYPDIIRQSYPVYIQERAKDNAKQAFEIIKILQDKKLVKLDKVSDFVNLMDELIKIL